jgi:hypothetical protein
VAKIRERIALNKQESHKFHMERLSLSLRIYKIIILAVVLYGCESWSLILREEHRLGSFKNGVLRSIFGTRKR